MRILVAEDEPVSRRMLMSALTRRGYEVAAAADGLEALAAMGADDPPPLAIIDWEMPNVDGVEVCRRLRQGNPERPPYLLLLTARNHKDDIVAGLTAGANDYIVKPFDSEELHARVRVGQRVVELQDGLALRVQELEQALRSVRQLHGLLPICAYCKSIRQDDNYWTQLESYLGEHSEAKFSHGVCPGCYETHVLPQMQATTSGSVLCGAHAEPSPGPSQAKAGPSQS